MARVSPLAQSPPPPPPFGCLKIFRALPQYLHPPPPCHVKWTFPKKRHFKWPKIFLCNFTHCVFNVSFFCLKVFCHYSQCTECWWISHCPCTCERSHPRCQDNSTSWRLEKDHFIITIKSRHHTRYLYCHKACIHVRLLSVEHIQGIIVPLAHLFKLSKNGGAKDCKLLCLFQRLFYFHPSLNL